MNKQLSGKQFIFACVGILIFGLIFLGGLNYFLNPTLSQDLWSLTGPITSTPRSFNLEINSPDNNLLAFDKTVVISGKSSPKATIIVSNGESNTGFEADLNGDFSKVIELLSGMNLIKIVAFDSEGNSKEEERMVYFSEEGLEKKKN